MKKGIFMNKKLLGNSDLSITEIGFGAWAIGGNGWDFGWGPQNDEDSETAIQKAIELGINWIDTAAIYGLGHSEIIVGKTLKNISNKPYIFTKCGLVWDDQKNITRNIKPESIRKECENSLRRLNVDVIDLYQIHWPSGNDAEIPFAWEMMTKLKEEGKVRWIGVCNFNVDQIKLCETISPVTSLQPIYNIIKRDIEKEILQYCIENNIGVIAYSPMMSGLLSGKMTKERIANLPEDDWRRRNAEFKEPNLSKNLALVNLLSKIGNKYNALAGEVAIAWTLKNDAVTGAIVGARNSKQVEEIINSSEIYLSQTDILEIENFMG